jgi:hypothetical protein
MESLITMFEHSEESIMTHLGDGVN